MATASEKTTVTSLMEMYRVQIAGLAPIMFQQFIDDTQQYPPEALLYLVDDQVILPATNVLSFLTSKESGRGCAATFTAKTRKRDMCRKAAAYIRVGPDVLPFTTNGELVTFGGFPGGTKKDAKSGIYVAVHKALVKKNNLLIPQIRRRPVLPLPWELEFNVTIIQNDAITFAVLNDWLERGGIEIALGAFRPYFGSFHVLDISELEE